MKKILLFSALILITSCSPKEEKAAEQQIGTVATGISNEVIDSELGYIVQNAVLTDDVTKANYNIKGLVNLQSGMGSVLIVRTTTEDGNGTEILALQLRAFTGGTRMEFLPDDGKAGFWLFGVKDGRKIMKKTGTVEGLVRMIKKGPSTMTMGLDRELMNGVGEMEIIVKDIESEGLTVPVEKKYAARYALPLITLEELAGINLPI